MRVERSERDRSHAVTHESHAGPQAAALNGAFPSWLGLGSSVFAGLFLLLRYLQSTDEEGAVCHPVTVAGSPSQSL